MNIKISVIIPLYNVEEYVERCLYSVMNQSYTNLDILIVDDGSTDSTAEICKKVCAGDERVHFLCQNNAGVVRARNLALKHAKGEYVLFVDGDDTIEKDAIVTLVNVIRDEEPDIISFGIYREKRDKCTITYDSIAEGVYTTSEELAFLFKNMIMFNNMNQKGIQSMMCSKLYKLSIIKPIMLDLDDRISVGEDEAIIYSTFVYATKIVIIKNALYHYINRSNSAVNAKNDFFIHDIDYIYTFIKKNYIAKDVYNLLKYQLERYVCRYLLINMKKNFDLCIPYYILPKLNIQHNSRIILYGAGAVGKDYYMQIIAEGNYHLVSWVDKQYELYKFSYNDIASPNVLQWSGQYDYIVVAVLNDLLAESIRNELMRNYFVEEERIIWLPPITIMDQYRAY